MVAKPRREINKEEIRTLYSQGFSTRKVSKLTGVSKSYIARICEDLLRTKSEALKGKLVKPESIHWRTLRGRARKLVEEYLGKKLESWEVVHHKDKNPSNNDLSNLEVLSNSEHTSQHHRGSEYNIPRHLRPKRKDYMKLYLKTYLKAWRLRRKNAS